MVAGSGMTDQSPIQYISGLLDAPASITVADNAGIKAWQDAYPYFIPIRYAAAVESVKLEGLSPKVMSGIQPYLGNWMLFCDFIDAARTEPAIVTLETKKVKTEEPAPKEKAEITEPPAASAVADAPQPVVKVSEEFLHLIREDAAEPVVTVESKEDASPAAHSEAAEEHEIEDIPAGEETSGAADELISAVYTQDYFLQQGERVSDAIPEEITAPKANTHVDDIDKSLMVMMSFSEWLQHFKSTAKKQEEERKDQKALKTMWQKEKLAAALEEENEEIPENVFEMAVNSITKEDGLASESLAEIYIKQAKYDKAIEMYKKLSLRNPQKNAYFARKIEAVLKEKQS